MTKQGMTIEEIAAAQDLSRTRIYQISQSRDFPLPDFVLGRNKIYDPKKVARYFANREKRKSA
jgi:hypothetical protein